MQRHLLSARGSFAAALVIPLSDAAVSLSSSHRSQPPTNQGYPCPCGAAAIITVHGPAALPLFVEKQHLTETLKAGYQASQWAEPAQIDILALALRAANRVHSGAPVLTMCSHYPVQRGTVSFYSYFR